MGKSGRKSLKTALQSHHSRQQAKNKAQKAEQLSRLKIKTEGSFKPKGKGKPTDSETRATIPFQPTDKILLVGEGNFSFARALVLDAPSALEFLPSKNVTATAFDSEEECYSKYPEAESIVDTLRQKGVEVLFEVDATNLNKTPALKRQKWNRIVWNFPHAGKGITDQDRNILSNQMLILGFLRSAASFLASGSLPLAINPQKLKKNDDDDDEEGNEFDQPDSNELGSDPISAGVFAATTSTRGTVLITLRNVSPYTLWDVPRLAKNPPAHTSPNKPNVIYTLLRSFVFHKRVWKGYEHRMTKGERAHGLGSTGHGGEDRTWEFYVRD